MGVDHSTEFPRTEVAERRESLRIPVEQQATLLLGHLGSAIPCSLIDISLDGCRVRADLVSRGEMAGPVEIAFKINGIPFRLGGVTEWTDGGRVLGVRFVALSPRREAELAEYLGELAADLAAKAEKDSAGRQAADEEAKSAREAVETLTAELTAKTGQEEAAKAALERAVRETREVGERLTIARSVLAGAEKAAADYAAREAARLKMAEDLIAIPVRGPDSRTQEAGKPGSDTALRGDEVTGSRPHGPPAAPPAEIQPGMAKTAPAASRGGDGADSPPRPAGRERRSQTRHAVDCTAKIFLVTVMAWVRGRIIDVSMSGCRIRCDENFAVGIYRRVEVEFILDGLPFRLPGVVQAVHDKITVGIRFIDLSERKNEQLSMVIEEMTEMRRDEPARSQGGVAPALS